MPRMISMSFITGAGLKKCMPMTFSGRFVAAAISVIDSDEVLEARMVSGLQIASSWEKTFFFRSMLSMVASITIAQSAARAKSVVPDSLARISVFSVAVSFSFFNLPRQPALDAGKRLVDDAVLQVRDDHLKTILGERLRNSAAHRARAENKDLIHHDSPLFC